MAKSSLSHCHVMAKPTGSVCNLDCSYCFYLEKEKLYPGRNKHWMMNDETLSNYIEQYIKAQPHPEVEFVWQGGEPTMMGLDFFKKVIELQQTFSNGKSIRNCIQTNGILLNEAWCKFLKKHEFLVGISIDGPADLHDHYRVNRSGKPSHDKVVKAIEKLKKYKVEFNILTVVNDYNAEHPERVYEFLLSTGAKYLQFIPLVERSSSVPTEEGLYLVSPEYSNVANVTPWSVIPEAYGQFLCRVFDQWIRNDVGEIFVQMFDTTLASWYGMPPGVCVFAETCGHNLALESNGDVYNCDHYVYPEHRLGNIHTDTILDMNNSEKAIEFGLDKKSTLSKDCRECQYKFACHGGCPKHRFAISSSGKAEQNYFCKSYKQFFKHSEAKMRTMVELISHHRPASDIMRRFVPKEISTKKKMVARNDSCLCGSGKKYKKCCMNQ
ncbi:anaerobic sulfatase maturase [Photobacterium sagamiensis]|uniref:anaerobic sulfatase maturase n=1 Tax=Photobacterium sagamiensis TaxID=2910241 RepID=UPI003D151659